MARLSKIIATLFYVGYVPFAPGTVASALAIPIYIALRGNSHIYLTFTIVMVIIGFLAINRAVTCFKESDPKCIVIDEFASMFIVYLFLPFTPGIILAGFILFRFFDITKMPIIKKLESFHKGYGIMLDDIAAAILSNMVLQVLLLLKTPFLV